MGGELHTAWNILKSSTQKSSADRLQRSFQGDHTGTAASAACHSGRPVLDRPRSQELRGNAPVVLPSWEDEIITGWWLSPTPEMVAFSHFGQNRYMVDFIIHHIVLLCIIMLYCSHISDSQIWTKLTLVITGWWFQPTPLTNDGIRQLGWCFIPNMMGKS